MSLINDKKNVFTQVSVLTSIGQRVETTNVGNSNSSINNKKEVVPFLLDLLVRLKGTDAVQKSTGDLLTNFVKKAEPMLKSTLKSQLLPFNSNQSIPPNFAANGYDLPMNKIDNYGKLKTNPDTTAGSLMYSDNTQNFDRSSYNAIRNPGTETTSGNVKLKFNEVSNSMTVKPLNNSDTIGTFLNNYVDSMEIINPKEFNTQVTNEIFGNISSQQNKSYEQIVAEQKLKKTIERLINGEDNLDLTEQDIIDIQNQAENIEKGVNVLDLGCGFFDTSITLDQTTDFISNISGSTDPEFVSNQYANLLNTSLGNQSLGQNEIPAKDSFFKRIIKKIIEILVTAITSTPQIMVLKILIESFKNGGTLTTPASAEDDIKSSRNLSDCLANSVKSEINRFIYDSIVVELLKIVKNSSKVIIREKLNAFAGILKSLSF